MLVEICYASSFREDDVMARFLWQATWKQEAGIFVQCHLKTTSLHALMSFKVVLWSTRRLEALTWDAWVDEWVTLFGGMEERWNGMAEQTEYSKIRNTRNILQHGKYWIFWNAEYTEYSKTRNIRISLKRGMRGKSLKQRIWKIHFLSVSSMGTITKLRMIIVHFLAPKEIYSHKE